MTDEHAKALGLRAVACPGWRWMPGMLDGCSVERVFERCGLAGLWVETRYDQPEAFRPYPGIWPDFRDPATLGCLLALVGEAWAAAMRAADYVETSEVILNSRWEACRRVDWTVATDGGGLGALGVGATRAESLVAALEAAPARVSP